MAKSKPSILIEGLNSCLEIGIDFYTQVKVVHWNIKGPNFLSLHPFLDTVASFMAESNDSLAERAVILGGYAKGSLKNVAIRSPLEAYPIQVKNEQAHLKNLLKRIQVFHDALVACRKTAEALDDASTVDLLTQITETLEKHTWFMEASSSS